MAEEEGYEDDDSDAGRLCVVATCTAVDMLSTKGKDTIVKKGNEDVPI